MTGPAASYEPKRLRLPIFAVAGRLIRTARCQFLKIDSTWPGGQRDHDRSRLPSRPRTLTPPPDPPDRTRSTGRHRRAANLSCHHPETTPHKTN
ncbi:MAG: hypothetical protein LC808_18530 [Actinobacteria bacterium]|nr:hypothetical protein [Actinomycetota bacterium]